MARPLWEGEAFLEKPFNNAGLIEAVAMLLHGTIDQTGMMGYFSGLLSFG